MGTLLSRIGILFALACACLAAPASAAQLDPDCIFATSQNLSVESVRADPRWVCDEVKALGAPRFNWLRFEDTSGADFRYYAMEARWFDSITVYRIASDGRIASNTLVPDEVRLKNLNDMMVPLPQVGDPQAPVFVRIDNYAKFRDAPNIRLLESAEKPAGFVDDLVFAALLMGLVLAPCILAAMLAFALRQTFVAWYAMMCAGMALTIAMTSGLAASWFSGNLAVFLVFERLGYVLIMFASCQFARDFIERDALSPAMRRALRWSGIFILVAGGLNAGLIQSPALFGFAQLIVLTALIAAFAQAVRRGSRWVRYQLVGWSFAMVLVTDMALKGVGLGGFLQTDFTIVYYAMVWEIIVVAVGVTDRAVMLRSDRDRARQLAAEMENLAERDPLTGLLNRRGIANQYDNLMRRGFTTFALIDLDHFKAINDRFGHHIGDEALIATASALAPDEDTLAVRLGGEEFMLVLRGADATLRAERRRRAITTRIADMVPEMDRPVTASMGVVEASVEDAAGLPFEVLYLRADTLLYRAKNEGRNRYLHEALDFAEPPGVDTRAYAA
ncbi:diguanylate cyclase [Citromicrobium bathyomarinum]|uniref:sensor domain-containing diguanylate cyclase n=1 Tax=Citromicrobium bathyomarinum TaxID=72174 RepID=UPI003159C25B